MERVEKPWGYYEVIKTDSNFRVKILGVNPKSKLSLQLHKHRKEFWVVTKGIVRAIVGEETYILTEGGAVVVPENMKHRIENPTDKEAVIVEVWVGDDLMEDDIVRFEDEYGRV